MYGNFMKVLIIFYSIWLESCKNSYKNGIGHYLMEVNYKCAIFTMEIQYI